MSKLKVVNSTNHTQSVIDRFHKYTLKGDGCWEWIGSLMVRGGYGQLNDRKKLLKAHRLSYELYKGEIPKGLFICHKCNNSKCVNPEHLYAGTPQDNINDKIEAGTQFKIPPMRGEESPNAKLNWEKVRMIRESTESGVSLAKKFNVSKTNITSIRKGKTWKEII